MASTWKTQLTFQKGWEGFVGSMGFFFRCQYSWEGASPGPRGTWSQCLCFQKTEFHRQSVLNNAAPTPRDTEPAFKDLPKSSISAPPPLTQNTKLSVYFPAGWLEVYVVSTHVTIFIFPSIPINFLTHFTELTFPFTSASASSARSTCINYFSRHCHHCKRAHLRQGVPTSPSQTWTQMLWSPVHDLNYCPTRLSRVLGCRYCPRLVLFHTCSLFISLYNWLRCRSKNPKIW